MKTTKTAENGTKNKNDRFSSARENEVARNEMYLSFRLADNDFGVEIGYVVEIVGMKKITELPQMPVFVKGVVDYRGNMILVTDLRIYLDYPPRSGDELFFIVVISYQGEFVGLIVDKINEVRAAKQEELIPVRSRYGKGKTTKYA